MAWQEDTMWFEWRDGSRIEMPRHAAYALGFVRTTRPAEIGERPVLMISDRSRQPAEWTKLIGAADD